MGPASEALGAIGESVVFLDHFNDLPDPRQRGKIIYPLAEVLLLCLLAVLGSGDLRGYRAVWREEDRAPEYMKVGQRSSKSLV
jgi:hypothetical protein